MKKIILIIALLTGSIKYCNAIEKTNEKMPPLFLSLGLGTPEHFSIGLTCLWNKKNALEFHMINDLVTANNIPSDYSIGLLETTIKSSTLIFGLGYSRIIPFETTKSIRMKLESLITIGSYKYPDHFMKKKGSTLFSSNYDYDDIQKTCFGLYLKPTMEMSRLRYFGVSLGLFVNVNTQQSAFGIEFSLLFGKIRYLQKNY